MGKSPRSRIQARRPGFFCSLPGSRKKPVHCSGISQEGEGEKEREGESALLAFQGKKTLWAGGRLTHSCRDRGGAATACNGEQNSASFPSFLLRGGGALGPTDLHDRGQDGGTKEAEPLSHQGQRRERHPPWVWCCPSPGQKPSPCFFKGFSFSNCSLAIRLCSCWTLCSSGQTEILCIPPPHLQYYHTPSWGRSEGANLQVGLGRPPRIPADLQGPDQVSFDSWKHRTLNIVWVSEDSNGLFHLQANTAAL